MSRLVSFEECLVRVEEGAHPAARRGPNVDQRALIGSIGTWIDVRAALNEELDRDAAGRDPAVRRVDVKSVAIADRAVMDHQAPVAPPRAGPEVIEVAAFVVDDGGRHTSPPQSSGQSFVTTR